MRILFSIIALTSLSLASIERGKELYAQVCFHCHGPNLEGGKGPALTDAYWRHGSSTNAIMKVINKGIAETEMIGYEQVFPEADRKALLDFVLSQQKGVRNLSVDEYKDEFFKGKPLNTETFSAVEATTSRSVPENTFWVDNGFEGGMHFKADFHAWKKGEYRFALNGQGETVVLLNGEIITRVGKDVLKEEEQLVSLPLDAGIHTLEIFHVSKRKHGHRISGHYELIGGERITFQGRSLQGSAPKLVVADPMRAKVVRKWIRDISPRALLCLLPNNVIVAYDPVKGGIDKAWHSARINQTPSLPDRSASPSVVIGQEILNAAKPVLTGNMIQFLSYEVKGNAVHILSEVDGKEQTTIITPKDQNAFSIN